MEETTKKVNNLLNELKDTDNVKNIVVEGYKEEKIKLTDITIKIAKLNNVEIIRSNLANNTFMNTEFYNCNFSNTSFNSSSFINCQFINL